MSFGVSDAISMVTLIRQVYRNRRIISALFDWEGKRIEGNEKLKVRKLGGFHNVWWYTVEPIDDYQFVRIPVNPGAVVEAIDYAGKGTSPLAEATDNPISNNFRYVPVHWPQEAVTAWGFKYVPNAKVSFMVFAYRPSDLLAASKDSPMNQP